MSLLYFTPTRDKDMVEKKSCAATHNTTMSIRVAEGYGRELDKRKVTFFKCKIDSHHGAVCHGHVTYLMISAPEVLPKSYARCAMHTVYLRQIGTSDMCCTAE